MEEGPRRRGFSRDRARCNARAAVHKQRRASQSAPAKVTRVMSRCPLCRTNSATRPKVVTSWSRSGAEGGGSARTRARERVSFANARREAEEVEVRLWGPRRTRSETVRADHPAWTEKQRERERERVQRNEPCYATSPTWNNDETNEFLRGRVTFLFVPPTI